MSEKEHADEFDPETAELARRLSELDFSEEASMRESLRERLVARGEALRRTSWGRRWVPLFAPAAALAAAFLGLFVGLPSAPAPAPEPPSGGDRVLVRRPMVNGKALVPESILSEPWEPEAIALGTPSGALERLTAADLMETVAAQVVESESGRTVTWRMGQDVFILETRKTTLGEIFEKMGSGFD